MKKTYINPEMEVVKVNAQQLLAGSLGDFDTPMDFDFDDEEFFIEDESGLVEPE